MAINVRKGSAHSLTQTDFVGAIKSGEGVDAGHLVKKNSDGEIVKAASGVTGADLLGFAVTSQSEGDAIASGKLGAYALDGGSVIETSYFVGSVTAADVGKFVIPSATAGSVEVSAAVANADELEVVVGKVYDIPRSIYVGQSSVTVLPIKLTA